MHDSTRDLTVLASGRGLLESPRWHDGRLWFADWTAGEIVAVDGAGVGEVIGRLDGLPISIDWLPDGRLLIVSGADGRLLRREPDGRLVTHADLTDIAEPPWNDIVVDGRGNAYVDNPAVGLLALVRPDGSAAPVAQDLAFPNGLAVTPDNATLVLAESYGRRLTAWDVAADGRLSGRRTWADLGDGVPDGICIDEDGAVWYADVPNSRCVRVREGGDVLETVRHDRGCFACTLGGPDRRTLFVVAADWQGMDAIGEMAGTGQVLTTEAPARAAGWP